MRRQHEIDLLLPEHSAPARPRAGGERSKRCVRAACDGDHRRNRCTLARAFQHVLNSDFALVSKQASQQERNERQAAAIQAELRTAQPK